jgi:hypothetical protein
VADYAVPKAIDSLLLLRRKLAAIVDRYLDVQQDILETFVDRGQLADPEPAHHPLHRQNACRA